MLKDHDLDPGVASAVPPKTNASDDEEGGIAFPMAEVLEKRGELIRKYAEQWTVNTHDKAELQAKIDELSFLVTLLYGVAGLQEGKNFNGDFYS